jgi:predicted TIM-barrel fold metal-dependent hydrolase
MADDVDQLLTLMDSCNIASVVNLDGRWGSELEANLDRYDRTHPGRFFTFCHLDWRLLEQPNGPDLLTRSLERSVAAGACGLKVWKDLGISVRVRGQLIRPDDPILGPVWDAVADLGIPMLIHVADPLAFFQPVDHNNERLEELLRRPDFSRQKEGLEGHKKLIDSLENLVSAHPRTNIVAAHVGCVENLERVSTMLTRYPNLSVDIGWRASDLGRQPRAARRLCIQHPGRVLFGTDAMPLRSSIYEIFFRLLETDDEAFAYSDADIPPCGRWPIYGLDLPEAVLEAIYRANAARLLGLPDTSPRALTYDETTQTHLRGISCAP